MILKNRFIPILFLALFARYVDAELVADNFESGHNIGATPVQWSTKWLSDTNAPLQRNLATVESGIGVQGSQAVHLNVNQAKADYRLNSRVAISGKHLLVSGLFKIHTTGEALTNGVNGVNQSFIASYVSMTPDWFNGPHFDMGLARRSDNNWGLRVPAPVFVEGFVSNSELGLAEGLVASESDWFRMTLELFDVGTGWVGVTSVVTADGTVLLKSGSFPLPAAFTSGAPLYGGFTTAFNSLAVPVGEIAKVSAIYMDDFAFGAPTRSVVRPSVGQVMGFEFTSEAGKNHRLQYSVVGDHLYRNTGESVLGDGTVKVLVDPASDAQGHRTYRVTSD